MKPCPPNIIITIYIMAIALYTLSYSMSIMGIVGPNLFGFLGGILEILVNLIFLFSSLFIPAYGVQNTSAKPNCSHKIVMILLFGTVALYTLCLTDIIKPSIFVFIGGLTEIFATLILLFIPDSEETAEK